MRAVLALCLALVTAAPVDALSCLRPNMGKTFNELHQRPETYVIAVGHLTVPAEAVPDAPRGAETTAVAHFSGRFLSAGGLGEQRDAPVEVISRCLIEWCGPFPDGQQKSIYFLQSGSDGLQLDSGPCPNGSMMPYRDVRVDLLQRCLRNGGCSTAVVDAFERE